MAELSEATVVVPGNLDAEVRWASVIEWPVENFVGPGDFVLTTGVGVTLLQLRDMFDQIAAAGASAICMATGPGAFHASIPAPALESARASGLTVIQVPWRVRFSDISRGVIMLANGFRMSANSSGLPSEFSDALLSSSPLDAISEALERAIASPVAMVDAGLSIVGSGPRGGRWFAAPNRKQSIVDVLDGLTGYKGNFPYRLVPPELGAALTFYPAYAPDGIIGWLVTSGDTGAALEATQQALTALSIALLQDLNDEEASSYARENLFREASQGELIGKPDVASRARLVGLPAASEYKVAVGLLETDETSTSSLSPRAVARILRRRFTHPGSAIVVQDHELLCCRSRSETTSLAQLNALLPRNASSITWGEAEGWHGLDTIGTAVPRARTALAVTRALHGPGTIGAETNLGGYLLVSRFAHEEQAQTLAARILGPLETADESRSSEFLRTLEAFLDANGNTSQAARALYLNRHSLIYRRRRITELTGLDLESREDRFQFELALRIRKLSRHEQ